MINCDSGLMKLVDIITNNLLHSCIFYCFKIHSLCFMLTNSNLHDEQHCHSSIAKVSWAHSLDSVVCMSAY